MIKPLLILLGFFLNAAVTIFAVDQNEMLKKIESFQIQSNNHLTNTDLKVSEKKCTTCPNQTFQVNENDSPVLIFMSFSIPDSLWLSLSQELEEIGGTFVLQGLPSNSFKELSNKIYELRQKNVKANIQLFPQLFQKYEIKHVPTFVLMGKDDQLDKLTGSVSLDFVLNQFSRQGKNQLASSLLNQLRGRK